MKGIRNIECELSDSNCTLDVNVLHEFLLRMPAELYIRLFHLMTERITNPDVSYDFPEDFKGRKE